MEPSYGGECGVGSCHREPIALEALAISGGIHVRFDHDMHEDLSGLFVPITKGTQEERFIVINSQRDDSHQRFTFAHELAHAAHSVGNPDRLNQTKTTGNACDADEHLCHRVAAELLMPADMVLLEVFQAGMANTNALARRFKVSLTSMRVRLRTLGLL